MRADLADAAAVHELLEGVDAVPQLGGVSLEAPLAELVPANVTGLYNVYEAARRQGVVYGVSDNAVRW